MKKMIIAAFAALAAVAAPASAQQAVDQDFVQKLRAALEANPEIVQQALAAAQNSQRERQQAEIAARVAPVRAELLAPGFGPVIGNPDGAVSVVEFVDYACPVCKTAHQSISSIVSKRPEVRVVIANGLIFGEQSEKLARFALASDLQGRFPQVHDALYDTFGDHHDTEPTDDRLREIAARTGVDYDRAVRDMTGERVSAIFANQTRVADAIGVAGTPFFVTRDGVYPGAAPEPVMNEAFR